MHVHPHLQSQRLAGSEKLHAGWWSHMLQAITLVKEIELSHWGNIYVEEKYELVSSCS